MLDKREFVKAQVTCVGVCVSVRAILVGISFFFFLENCFCSEDTWTVNYKTPIPKTSHILIEKGNKTHKSTQFSHCVKTKENIKN